MRFVAFQSDEGRLLAERHGIDPDDTDSFLFIDGGKSLVKSAGVAAVCAPVSAMVVLGLHDLGPAPIAGLGLRPDREQPPSPDG